MANSILERHGSKKKRKSSLRKINNNSDSYNQLTIGL